MGAAQLPFNRRADTKLVVHIYNEILLDHKRNEILPFGTAWRDLEGIMLSKISQIEKDK